MLTTIEDKMEEVDSTTSIEKGNNNLKEKTTTTTTEEDQNKEFSYTYEQDPGFKTLMTNFDNSVLIESFQNQYLHFDSEKILNVNPTFFYNDEIFNPENYEITSKELFEKLVKNRTAFMNILLIDLSVYSNFSICGAQVFPNLKQTCIKLKDVTDFIEIKKELYNACYLVFEDQWDRKDNSTIIIFDDDGKSQYARAFTEICIEGQWGCEAFMLKDGILSFMKEYPFLCISEDFNEDEEYDDDDEEEDYYYNEGIYKTINNNTLNQTYTNTIEMVDIKDNINCNNESNDNNQDINTIFNNSTNVINTIGFTDTNNAIMNDIDMTNANATPYQTNNILLDNTIQNTINEMTITIENETIMDTNTTPTDNLTNTLTNIPTTTTTTISSTTSTNNDNNNINQEHQQIDRKRKIDNIDEESRKNPAIKNEEDINLMDYQSTIQEELNQNDVINESDVKTEFNIINNMTMNNNDNNNTYVNNITNGTIPTEIINENTINMNTIVNPLNMNTMVETQVADPLNSSIVFNDMNTIAQNGTTTQGVTDTMACYDPRQMAVANVDYNNSKFFRNNQTEDIIRLRKFQRYLIHNVWYAMDNSNDVPLMVCPPFLYLGSLYTSQEHHLINYNIKHVIRLGTDFNISYSDPTRFKFYNFDIYDLPKEPIKELFERANNIIEQARLNHENVLVHCHAGVSRSSTIILAYLMKYRGMSLYDAWCSTFKIRPIIRPNDGFAIALQEYEKMLFNCNEPTMPVVGMSNSYLFSIEYFDFVSRLEEMHKLDPTVPVFRPEKTYEDLLIMAEKDREEEEAKEKEKQKEKVVNDNETQDDKIIDTSAIDDVINGTLKKDINNKVDENGKIEEEKSKSESSGNTISKSMKETNEEGKLEKNNIKNENQLELDKSNELKTREE